MGHRTLFISVLFFIVLALFSSCSQDEKPVAYLFAYFAGSDPGLEQVHYAISLDGFNYYALNDNKPIINSEDISSSGGVRDPHLLRGHDGWFYMVVTDLYVSEMGWKNTAMVLLKSRDLINWEHSIVDIPKTYPGSFGDVYRVWAPQTIYDAETKKYMLYWSMIQPGGKDIIYYAYANDDFTGLEDEPQQLLYKNGACIDGDIILKDGIYHLFFKNEDEGAKGILKAESDKINRDYTVSDTYVDQTDSPVEGSGTFKLIGKDRYILMYDMYTSGKYQFCMSQDLEHFEVIDQEISMNFHPRHGSVLTINQRELDLLLNKWGKPGGLIQGSGNDHVKENNIMTTDTNIYIPVRPETDLGQFDPELRTFPGMTFTPQGKQDFSYGPVQYEIAIGERVESYAIDAAIAGNPILYGYYADPEIFWSEKEHRYYLYPTSDGFRDWSGTYFEVFESTDLTKWSNRGKILDLKKDVSWADRNAWAPCAIETKVNDQYKYFFYFTADKKIGVASSDEPTGPFTDSGKPLIDFKPEGINRGIEIDPDVFFDSISGKHYLYWGNGYLAVVELNQDMISIKKESLRVITPNHTFREGVEVFFRNGKYYFLWSENDTRSPEYRVRYALSDSPVGPLTIPDENIVIEKDESQEIYATGHNSVIKNSKTNEWYIVYHRFTRPKGIDMGRAGGFHREVCIDELKFDKQGQIVKVHPTLVGIKTDD